MLSKNNQLEEREMEYIRKTYPATAILAIMGFAFGVASFLGILLWILLNG